MSLDSGSVLFIAFSQRTKATGGDVSAASGMRSCAPAFRRHSLRCGYRYNLQTAGLSWTNARPSRTGSTSFTPRGLQGMTVMTGGLSSQVAGFRFLDADAIVWMCQSRHFISVLRCCSSGRLDADLAPPRSSPHRFCSISSQA